MMQTIGCCCVKRCPAVLVLLVYLCSVLNQESHHHQVIIQHSLQPDQDKYLFMGHRHNGNKILTCGTHWAIDCEYRIAHLEVAGGGYALWSFE